MARLAYREQDKTNQERIAVIREEFEEGFRFLEDHPLADDVTAILVELKG